MDAERDVTLADLALLLYRRRNVLAATVAVALLVGVVATAAVGPQYEARLSILPLASPEITRNWLSSPEAAGDVVDRTGDDLASRLFPSRWENHQGAWKGEPPTRQAIVERLLDRVDVRQEIGADQPIIITATAGDPGLARDLANGFTGALDTIRSVLENQTRQAAYERHFTGSNGADAASHAEATVNSTTYWLVLETAVAPDAPITPRWLPNLALSAAIGLLLGIIGSFGAEWGAGIRGRLRSTEDE